jgi:AcrR family transcriptional regulator
MAHDLRDSRDPQLPAHRPSRRNEIVAAAVRQFARQGFTDASMAGVAEEAGVAVTAVYYHFSGKEELYSAAVTRVVEAISGVVAAARGDTPPEGPRALDVVIDAVWSWIDDHPDEAALLYTQLPGATPQVTKLRQQFEEQHVQQAFVYFAGGRRGRPTAARRSVETLMAHTLVDLLISVHTMRLSDGPLSASRSEHLRAAVHRLAGRLVSA